MIERRRRRRRHLSPYPRVFDVNTDESIGQVVDISTEGLRILSESPVATDREYRLRLEPTDAGDSGRPVEFDAVCVWLEKEFSSGAYNGGFRILKISKRNRETLERLIERFGD